VQWRATRNIRIEPYDKFLICRSQVRFLSGSPIRCLPPVISRFRAGLATIIALREYDGVQPAAAHGFRPCRAGVDRARETS